MTKFLFALLLSSLAITSIQPSGEPVEEEEEFCCVDHERLDVEKQRLAFEKARHAKEMLAARAAMCVQMMPKDPNETSGIDVELPFWRYDCRNILHAFFLSQEGIGLSEFQTSSDK
mgnify:CR=1 FL=1